LFKVKKRSGFFELQQDGPALRHNSVMDLTGARVRCQHEEPASWHEGGLFERINSQHLGIIWNFVDAQIPQKS
jgi:hypothetical protein